jgi:hypothetical protein
MSGSNGRGAARPSRWQRVVLYFLQTATMTWPVCGEYV